MKLNSLAFMVVISLLMATTVTYGKKPIQTVSSQVRTTTIGRLATLCWAYHGGIISF